MGRIKLARPDLPAHHPQNTPLEQWTDGWLKLSVTDHTDLLFMTARDDEKRARGWPVTREEMIELLVLKGDVPAAGRKALAEAGEPNRKALAEGEVR